MTTQVPEWEGNPKTHGFFTRKPVPSAPETAKEEEAMPIAPAHAPITVSPPRPTMMERFDKVLPAHRTYLGRSRRTFLIILLAAFLCLLALVIGLGVGLSKKHSA